MGKSKKKSSPRNRDPKKAFLSNERRIRRAAIELAKLSDAIWATNFLARNDNEDESYFVEMMEAITAASNAIKVAHAVGCRAAGVSRFLSDRKQKQ